eukprot:scaffold51445_cov38-Cyclotella_meneghiniana.AAC.1
MTTIPHMKTIMADQKQSRQMESDHRNQPGPIRSRRCASGLNQFHQKTTKISTPPVIFSEIEMHQHHHMDRREILWEQ